MVPSGTVDPPWTGQADCQADLSVGTYCTFPSACPTSLLDGAYEPVAQFDAWPWSNADCFLLGGTSSQVSGRPGPRLFSRILCRADGPTSGMRGVLGAFACPPKLLDMVTGQLAERLLLLISCACGNLPRRDIKHHNHFGNQEHDYCHWLDIAPTPGQYDAWRVLL